MNVYNIAILIYKNNRQEVNLIELGACLPQCDWESALIGAAASVWSRWQAQCSVAAVGCCGPERRSLMDRGLSLFSAHSVFIEENLSSCDPPFLYRGADHRLPGTSPVAGPRGPLEPGIAAGHVAVRRVESYAFVLSTEV